MGFTKMFSSIVTSSIWVVDHPTLRVWIGMLAMADAKGYVEGSSPGLASLCRVTEEECEAALNIFSSPDPKSRNPENDGRRIEEVPGGWRILNYEIYRESRNEEERRKQVREATERWRAKKKNRGCDQSVIGEPNVSHCEPNVSPRQKTEDRRIHIHEGDQERSPKKKETNPNVTPFIKHFSSRFEQITGEKYLVVGSRDGNLVKKLLATFSIQDLIDKTELFFKSSDQFIQKTGYSIPIFFNQINKLTKNKQPSRWRNSRSGEV